MPKYVQIKEDRKDLFVTGSVNRDFLKLREFYAKNVDTFIKAYDVTRKLLKLKSEHKFFIRNIRGNTIGFYSNFRKEVAVDIRSRNIKSIVSTIIHECQHAFQYESGMLKKDSKPNYMIWKAMDTKITRAADGTVDELVASKKEQSIRRYKPSQNHKKYMDLPWEVDARAAEKKYIDKVMKEIS
jgi:hypothetical protein